ncbi:type VII secretion-associated protein [Actinopolyspora mortivallis]|uniref:Type VII secretion-associated protein n=1 Tax=Actinopolyspora mortivallis TaxID=33906 RepID=A0A2T0GVJ5_ACTMO|nr:type VII secretion-associated protein [Actinopolyspora mortivallis]PRW63120.1 type VII secretion-associated protein [Actinopolyspora mortivallis]
MSLHVAVDFGTSSTCTVAAFGDAPPRVVAVDGLPWVSSAVFAATDGTLFVGQEAERQAAVDPARFEPHPKRRIDEGELLLGQRVFDVEDVVRAVLGRAVAEAREQAGGAGVDLLVLTHPADWGSVRTGRLHRAADGLASEVVLLPEPVGAAVFHSAGDPVEGAALAVLDLGGGTVDASLVRGSGHTFRVLATRGEPDFGGADIDQALLEHIGSLVERSDPDSWRQLVEGRELADRRRRRVLRQDVRGAKETLSRHSYTDVPLPAPFSDVHVTRSDLESLVGQRLGRATDLVGEVLRDGGVSPEEVSGIFLVGGSSRVPLVARLVHERTGVVPATLDQPETVVARGALHAVRSGPNRGARRTVRIPSPAPGPVPDRRVGSPKPIGSAAPVPSAPSGPPASGGPSPRGSATAWPSGQDTLGRARTVVIGGSDPTRHVPVSSGRGGRRALGWIGGTAALLLGAAAVLVGVPLFRDGADSARGDGRQAPEVGEVTRYGYRFEYPVRWRQGGGDPEEWETRLHPPDGGGLISVRAGKPGYDVAEQRERSVRELRRMFRDRVASGDELSGFEADGEFAGRRVVHYVEHVNGSTVDWYLLHHGEFRISVGCRYPSEGDGRVRKACSRVVRTVTVR